MIFREAKAAEQEQLFREGYRVWSRGRTYEQYCAENSKEDKHGTRYVIEDNGEIVCSLIMLRLRAFAGQAACGIGSVVTHSGFEHRGYATALMEKCLAAANGQCAVVFLYSDIAPQFYERFGFKALPDRLQKKKGSTCMARCNDDIWNAIAAGSAADIPAYF
jgi:N-acetylglutamate synthase-like GNAT family acetyltransferase